MPVSVWLRIKDYIKTRTSEDFSARPLDLTIFCIRLLGGVEVPIQRRRPQGVKIGVGGGVFSFVRVHFKLAIDDSIPMRVR